MYEGTVSKVIEDRGFGFIRRTGAEDVFFHCTALMPGLVFDYQMEERRVKFDLEQTDKGPRAINVTAA